jgi:hypothetical protein
MLETWVKVRLFVVVLVRNGNEMKCNGRGCRNSDELSNLQISPQSVQ